MKNFLSVFSIIFLTIFFVGCSKEQATEIIDDVVVEVTEITEKDTTEILEAEQIDVEEDETLEGLTEDDKKIVEILFNNENTYNIEFEKKDIENIFYEELYKGKAVGVVAKKDNEYTIATFVYEKDALYPMAIEIEKYNYETQKQEVYDDYPIKIIATTDYPHIIKFNDNNFEVYKGVKGILFAIDNEEDLLYNAVCSFQETDVQNEVLELALSKGLSVGYSYYVGYYENKTKDLTYEEKQVYDQKEFDENIENILKENVDIIDKKIWRLDLPDDYTIYDNRLGYLNEDDLLDYAVIIERDYGLNDFEGTKRKVYILISNKDGTYNVLIDKNNIDLGRFAGGPFGDPYMGMDIKDGEFIINTYGGSSSRWGYEHTFYYDKGKDELKLKSLRDFGIGTFSLRGSEEVYDYLNMTYNKYNINYNGDEEDSEILDGLLLDSADIVINGIMVFDKEFGEVMILYPNDSMESYYMADTSISYEMIENYNENVKNIEITPTEVLNFVAEILQETKNLEKVEFTISDEIFNNYALVTKLDLPHFYYVGENSVLWYDGLSEIYDPQNENKNIYTQKVVLEEMVDGETQTQVFRVYKYNDEILYNKGTY